jgi:hypothetical protein
LRYSARSCVATLKVALNSALNSEPHCSAAPRTARSRAVAQLHQQLGAALQRSSTNSSEPRCSAAPRTAQSRATAQLHEEGDGNCLSPSSSWGCAATPCFFFLATLCCSIAAFFFFFLAATLQSCRHLPIWWGFIFFALLLFML